MEVNAADVKKLRDRTGMQMMKCKAALAEAGGDMEKAVEILRKQNKDAGSKSEGRPTSEGRVGVYIDPKTRTGAIVEVLCETAPVAKNELFVKLADDLARHVAAKGVAGSVEALLAEPFVDDASRTVKDRILELVGLMRENIKPVRMARLEGLLGQYVHHDGAVGVLIAVEGAQADPQLLREICMHIAAKNPIAGLRDQISQDRIDKEREIARAQAEEQGKGKAANIIDKIAEGKLRTWLAENVLVEQPFVKDESKTVGQLLQSAGLKLKKFVRLRAGQEAS
jgi:elongation factor Ts